jgi:hypothetical protein
MSIPRIYLETTMFNFPFVPDNPGYATLKADTKKVFDLIRAGKFEPFTSVYVDAELQKTGNEERRENMKSLVAEYKVKMLPASVDADRLAALYVAEGAVPAGYPEDALHIAMTTVHGLDFIVSLNFEHIARPWTVERVRRVNIREDYKAIAIYRPAEVLVL